MFRKKEKKQINMPMRRKNAEFKKKITNELEQGEDLDFSGKVQGEQFRKYRQQRVLD